MISEFEQEEELKNDEYSRSLNNCTLLYFDLLKNLNDHSQSKFHIYYSSYLTAIINNFLVIKDLYSKGYELQLQIMMRAQFEKLKIILCVLLDNNFFEQFSKLKENDEDFIPITPKQKHCDRILKKHFSSGLKKSEYSDWKEVQDFLYEEFSKSTHGNLTQVLLLSRYNEGENTILSLQGAPRVKMRTKNLVESFYLYSCIMHKNLEKRFKEIDSK